MKKLTSFFLTLSLISNLAFAECDFSTGIKSLPDGTYSYSAECHKRVGKMVLDLKDREEEVAKLNKTIELKDLALSTQEKRAEMWMGTSLKLEDRVNALDKSNSTTQWLFFGLGVLTMGAAVYGASRLVR